MFRLPLFWKRGAKGLVLGRRNTRFSPLYVLPEASSETASHAWIVGVSGSGKSKMLEHSIFQMTANLRGYGLIDPHSMLADDLISFGLGQIKGNVFSGPAPSAALASVPAPVASQAVVVNQSINFNVAAMDAASFAAFAEQNKGIIAGVVAEAARDSVGLRRSFRGRKCRLGHAM